MHALPVTYSQRAARHTLNIIQADMEPNDALINIEMATNSLALFTTDPFPGAASYSA
jgi:hypothetical protein